jgi:hypothetical protein
MTENYVEHAVEAERLAALAKDERERVLCLEIARAWRDLAQSALAKSRRAGKTSDAA